MRGTESDLCLTRRGADQNLAVIDRPSSESRAAPPTSRHSPAQETSTPLDTKVALLQIPSRSHEIAGDRRMKAAEAPRNNDQASPCTAVLAAAVLGVAGTAQPTVPTFLENQPIWIKAARSMLANIRSIVDTAERSRVRSRRSTGPASKCRNAARRAAADD
jgi:hypothetical protein